MSEKIRTGGLFRCCIDSLEQHLATKQFPSEEGEIHRCKYGMNSVAHVMWFHHNAWEWHSD